MDKEFLKGVNINLNIYIPDNLWINKTNTNKVWKLTEKYFSTDVLNMVIDKPLTEDNFLIELEALNEPLIYNWLKGGSDMEEPRFMKEDYAFIGEDEQWHVKDDAPGWAKEEFKDFFKMVNASPDENGVVVLKSN